MEKKASSFSGQIGFVLAAAGSAVGVGNLWRFPYLAAKDGGGLFLLVYLVLVLMIYFADHGEHIHDERLFSGRDIMYVRVPLIVWANEAWLRANPDRADALRAALQRPMSTANFAHMLMNLTGTSYAGYDSSLDVLSPDYIVRPRYVDESIWPGDKR